MTFNFIEPTIDLRFVIMSDGSRILQQAWQRSDGKIEWRNVEEVHYCESEEKLE